METTKFHNLCMAFGKAQNDFSTFQNDNHLLAVQIVKKLKEYLQVPESQFSLYKINEQTEFEIVPPALINALTIRKDAMWHFGIGLTVCSAPETLPQELILIHILIRKDLNLNNKYFIRSQNDGKEFEVSIGKEESYIPFFDYLQDTIIKTYNEQLQQFIGQNTRRKLGYK